MENHYSTLEVYESATPDEIKQAYRTLLQVWHPDRFQHSAVLLKKAEEKAKCLNLAFEVLSDAARRREYDHRLREDRKHSEHTTHHRHEILTTRCPNPSCDLSLRVKSRSIGKVTCPSCRTNFLYDPVRNEKWQVQYPPIVDDVKAPPENPTAPSDNGLASFPERRIALILLMAAVTVVGIFAWFQSNQDGSVMLNVPTVASPGTRLPEHSSATATTADEKATPESGDIATGPVSGEELIRSIVQDGEGELTVVNDTDLDGTFKLYDHAKNGGTLYRYWFIGAGHKVIIKDLGPCVCELYFALGNQWDYEIKGFRYDQQFWKYEKPVVFTIPKASEHMEWERYWIRILNEPSGVQSSEFVNEDAYNDLF